MAAAASGPAASPRSRELNGKGHARPTPLPAATPAPSGRSALRSAQAAAGASADAGAPEAFEPRTRMPNISA
jgi:hypothetical protein